MSVNDMAGESEHCHPVELTPGIPAEHGPEPAYSGRELSPLARLTSRAAFSSVLPKLRALLESIQRPGFSLLDTLSRNINDLQDAFTLSLYDELTALNVDFSTKITLRLNADARLEIVGTHPDAHAIATMLHEKEDLSAAFAEIAAQSAAQRDLHSLSILAGGADAAKNYNSLLGSPGENCYQISLKGDMNHFYFTRQYNS